MAPKQRSTKFSHASIRRARRGDKNNGERVIVTEEDIVHGSYGDSDSNSGSNKGSVNTCNTDNVLRFGNEDNMDVDGRGDYTDEGESDNDCNKGDSGRVSDSQTNSNQDTFRRTKRKREEKGKRIRQRKGVKISSYIKTTEAEEEAKRNVFAGDAFNNQFLSDYKFHVSRDVWHGCERGLLKLEMYVSKFEQWKVLTEHRKFKIALKKAGFWNVVKYHYKHHNAPLISSLVERWYPDTNTFHMPFGEITITLDDVMQILGVPILGDAPVCSSKIDMNDSKSLLERELGLSGKEVEEELSKKRSGGTSVSNEWLKMHFMHKVKDSSTDEEVHYAVRAYLLYLFGCLIFPKKSGTQVSIAYLELLLNFNKIASYAWGVSILCYTYRCLGNSSCANVMHIAGFVTLVETWAYEHFTIFRVPPNVNYNKNLPRMARWSNFLSSYPHPEKTLMWFRQCLDKMSPFEVYWTPYSQVRDVCPLHEKAFFHGVIGVLDMTEAYHAERVMRQLGYVKHVPEPPLKPKIKARNASGAKYDVHYEIAANFINQWSSHVLASEVRGRRAVIPWECDSIYMTWFCETCHPIMTPDDEFSELHMHPPCDLVKVIDEATRWIEFGLALPENSGEEGKESYKKALRHMKSRYVLSNTEEEY